MKTLKILVTVALANSLSIQSMEDPNLNEQLEDVKIKISSLKTRIIKDDAEVIKANDLKACLKKTLLDKLPKYASLAALNNTLSNSKPSDYCYIGAATHSTQNAIFSLGIRLVNTEKGSSVVVLQGPGLAFNLDHHADICGSSGPFEGSYITTQDRCESQCINFYENTDSKGNLEHLGVLGPLCHIDAKTYYAYPQSYLVCDFSHIISYLKLAMQTESVRRGKQHWKEGIGFWLTALGKKNNFKAEDITEVSFMCEDGSIQNVPIASSPKEEVVDAEKTMKHSVVLFLDIIPDINITI